MCYEVASIFEYVTHADITNDSGAIRTAGCDREG